jgi:hypothetical protein
MKKYMWLLITAGSLLAAGGVGRAASRTLLVADIPYEFTAAGNTFAAGRYEIAEADAPVPTALVIRRVDTGKTALVEFMTRLARRDNDRNTLVFDNDGTRRALSEIHLSASDGYFLPGATTKHAHVTVEAKKS